MNIEDIREYCLIKTGVTESLPFNDTALVFKVAGKMFALLDLSDEKRGMSLKCDPVLAIELRERYSAVTSAYHFNSKHWNGVKLDGSIPPAELIKWVDHSYDLVVENLPRKLKDGLRPQ